MDALYYRINFELDEYPTHADSIAIPIMQSVVFQIMAFPIWLGICYLVLRKYKKGISIFCWSKEKPTLSTLISIVFAGLAIFALTPIAKDLEMFRESISHGNPYGSFAVWFLSINSLVWMLLWILFRACCVGKLLESKTKTEQPSGGNSA